MVWFWFGSCFITLLLHVVFGSDTEVVVLRAVRGMEARLPCGQGRVFLDGPDSYVLWLKNDRDLLYRFPNEDSEHRTEQIFSSNCDGDMCRDETALYIKRVSEQHAGVYRCRVHYQASPSVDYVTELRLRDAPGMPRIYDENGDVITKGFVGPFSLGSDLTLTCDVNDEQPDTLVYWLREGTVASRATPARPGLLRATVRVRSLTRADLNAHYECRAHNADVTAPLAKSVRVHMYLPPLSVEIRLNNNPDFEAGQPRVVDCVVIGCVPPPAVTWHLADTLLRPTLHKELHDGNYTVSSLTVAPSLRDDAHKLECRAHNSHLPDGVFYNAITLNVGYRPTCLTTHEEGIGVSIKEAETVTCVVDAQPEPMQVSWTFADTRTLYTSVKKVPGHQHRYTSTLTWLPRESDYGELLCRATNAFGEQRRACAFAVLRGGSPRAPECVVMRAYPRAVRVQCKKGWDGGRPQTIHLELVSSSGALLHNISSQAGHFHLPDVGEHSNLTAQVYASSSRGRSQVERLHLVTMTPIQAEAVSVDTPVSWWPWVCAGVGAGVAAAAAAAAAVCAAAVRRRRRGDHNPDLVPRSDGSFHREPDFTREERVLGTTNITVNQLASCPNPYSPSPVPSCRVLVGCAARPQTEPCPSAQASYYV